MATRILASIFIFVLVVMPGRICILYFGADVPAMFRHPPFGGQGGVDKGRHLNLFYACIHQTGDNFDLKIRRNNSGFKLKTIPRSDLDQRYFIKIRFPRAPVLSKDP